MKNKAFTIIELLVVIAIIGLLAVMAIAALSSARTKAANSKKNAEITQYAKAMEMAYDKNGEYPDPGNTTTIYCLGKYPNSPVGKCWYIGGGASELAENAEITAAVSPFIPAMPGPGPVTCNRIGYIYQCLALAGGRCTSLRMAWVLQGVNQSCGGGKIQDGNWESGCTLCWWDISQ